MCVAVCSAGIWWMSVLKVWCVLVFHHQSVCWCSLCMSQWWFKNFIKLTLLDCFLLDDHECNWCSYIWVCIHWSVCLLTCLLTHDKHNWVYTSVMYDWIFVPITRVQGSRGEWLDEISLQGTSVLSPVVPLIYILAPAVLIAWKSPENLYLQNPIVYLLTFGCVSARVTNRLVVSLHWAFHVSSVLLGSQGSSVWSGRWFTKNRLGWG